jgi:periplasmic divalent cation tolerance protein
VPGRHMMDEAIVILATAASEDEAAKIAKVLVDEHLVACVNIVPRVRSFFFWDGATQDAVETLMICKSTKTMMGRVTERIRGLHSYSVPEVIALPVVDGLPAYLEWVLRYSRG